MRDLNQLQPTARNEKLEIGNSKTIRPMYEQRKRTPTQQVRE